MTYDPAIHHRRSLRLPGYDYTRAGAYFVTICTQDRACLFGEIRDGALQANEIGAMIAGWWGALAGKFPSIDLDASVLMPNHWHGILVLGDSPPATGAATWGGPYRPALGRVVGWFKTMSTNEYFRGVKAHGWPPVRGQLWQRNYYEHVIQNEAALERIRDYIVGNPAKWALDHENPLRLGTNRPG